MLYLLPLHAARGVEDQDHVLGHHLGIIDLYVRRHQQHKKAVLSALLVAEQVDTQILLGYGVVQGKILVRGHVPIFPPHAGAVLAIAVDDDRVAG